MKKSYIVDSTCNDMRLDRWVRFKLGKLPQSLIEKYLRLGKKETLQTTKMLVSKLQDIKSANKVKKTLSKRYHDRKGGYTSIIKAGFRYGDNAPMAIIEFVDRDVEAKRVDKPKKDTTKESPKTEEKKQATA